MDKGLLPRTKAVRTWGGRGSGLNCSLCDAPILATEPEMELEFDGSENGRATIRFHLQCHSIWDSERRIPAEGRWISVEKSLPPFDAPVEARLSMGAGRMVILSITRAKGACGETTWTNAITHTPLPTNWSPVEWRYTPDHTPADDLTESSASKRA